MADKRAGDVFLVFQKFARMSEASRKSRAGVFPSKPRVGRKQVRQSPVASRSEGAGFGEQPAVPHWERAVRLPCQCPPVWETRTDDGKAKDGREQVSRLQSDCRRVPELGDWNFISLKSPCVFPDEKGIFFCGGLAFPFKLCLLCPRHSVTIVLKREKRRLSPGLFFYKGILRHPFKI